MNFLVDTHILLWAASGSARLSEKARVILNGPENFVWFSVLSLWEVALKRSKIRSEYGFDVTSLRRNLQENGFSELEISAQHVELLSNLPWHHTDPFDRLLIAQAKAEGFLLLSADGAMARYGEPVLLV